jgi:TetR/AcrR family transcriptional repressor of lmrAB and yxaGH operons
LVNATGDLLEAKGYHATGLNEIVERGEAPKGSLYHYFPDGKEGLAAAAIAERAAAMAERTRTHLAALPDPADAVRAFILEMAEHVQESGCRAGGPIAAVALESSNTSERLRLACEEAYASLEAAFRDRLLAGGLTEDRATALATLITAAIEGGIILARTGRDTAPLRRVAEELHRAIALERKGGNQE